MPCAVRRASFAKKPLRAIFAQHGICSAQTSTAAVARSRRNAHNSRGAAQPLPNDAVQQTNSAIALESLRVQRSFTCARLTLLECTVRS
jgi:hypothetical protein